MLQEPEARIILTDQEAALTSRAFRSKMQSLFGLELHVLKFRNKAHNAESQIARFRSAIAAAVALRGNTKSWVPLVEAYVNSVNAKVIPGTNPPLRRIDVDASNFLDVIEARYGSADHALNNVEARGLSPQAMDAVFSYKLNSLCLLRAKYGLPTVTQQFYKPSQGGSFSRNIYRIVDRKIKYTRQLSCALLYKLEGTDARGRPLKGFFYEAEVRT